MRHAASVLVLFSGGQDSAVCLAYALSTYDYVETIGFDYGQVHSIELEARTRVLAEFRAHFPDWNDRLYGDHILPLPALKQIGGTALIDGGLIEERDDALPTSFVPGRNLVFLLTAAAYAYRRGLQVLIGGMCETDYSGYPDCRRAVIDLIENAIVDGMATDCRIETPLMFRTKAETWEMASMLGGDPLIEIILEHSHTCYYGTREVRHDWGYGCGVCPACRLRAEGYQRWNSDDLMRPRVGATAESRWRLWNHFTFFRNKGHMTKK